jgi:hypothetical protein
VIDIFNGRTTIDATAVVWAALVAALYLWRTGNRSAAL